MRSLTTWILLSCVASPVLLGAVLASERAWWLLARGNFEALSWKVPQIFAIISALTFVMSLVWVLPAIATWVAISSFSPRLEERLPSKVVGLVIVYFALTFAFYPWTRVIVPDASVPWVAILSAFPIWPRILVRKLRGRLRAA